MMILSLVLALAAQEWEQSFENAERETRERAASVERLSEEVSLLNLINGLYLTPDQSRKTIALAGEAGRLRDAALRRHAGLAADLEAVLKELRGHLAGSGEIPADLEQRVHAAEAAVRAARRAYLDELKSVEKLLCAVLTDAQRAVIESFNPCTIPPKDLKDPVRAGQAQGETHDVEEQIEMVRSLPDGAWRPVAEAVFDAFIGLQESLLGKLTPEARRAEIDRLSRVAEEARGMSDEDFEFEKGRLALEVMRPLSEFQGKAHDLTKRHLELVGGLTKAGKYLLNPRVAPLLEERLRRREVIQPANLDAADARRAAAEDPGPEPRFSLFAEWLGISGEISLQVRRALAGAQAELLTTLAAERPDGRNILSEFLKKLMSQKGAEAFAVLGTRLPDSEQTYVERIAQIRGSIDSKLQALLGAEKFARYRSSGIDPFKIKVGCLR